LRNDLRRGRILMSPGGTLLALGALVRCSLSAARTTVHRPGPTPRPGLARSRTAWATSEPPRLRSSWSPGEAGGIMRTVSILGACGSGPQGLPRRPLADRPDQPQQRGDGRRRGGQLQDEQQGIARGHNNQDTPRRGAPPARKPRFSQAGEWKRGMCRQMSRLYFRAGTIGSGESVESGLDSVLTSLPLKGVA